MFLVLSYKEKAKNSWFFRRKKKMAFFFPKNRLNFLKNTSNPSLLFLLFLLPTSLMNFSQITKRNKEKETNTKAIILENQN